MARHETRKSGVQGKRRTLANRAARAHKREVRELDLDALARELVTA